VRTIYALFLTFILLNLTGCEDKKSTNNQIPVENTTEVFISKDKISEKNGRFKLGHKKDDISAEPHANTSLSDKFILKDMKNTTYNVTVSNQKVTFTQNQKAIILVTFFATWCPPCLADIPYMNDLDRKYKKDLLLAGILSYDTITKPNLQSFLAKHDVRYFVSSSIHNNDFAALVAKTLRLPKDFSIPLTVMYVGGNYFTHYEGCVPVEMIDYDIQQALKTFK